MTFQQAQQKNIPDKPGVYFFLGSRREILYIGKATSLRDRVKSYFSKDLPFARGKLVVQMVEEAKDIDWRVTDSVLEALLVEASLIKTYKPKHNTEGKDDKSFNYVVVTKDNFPKVLLVRGRTLLTAYPQKSIKYIFGPFPHGAMLREAMKIIRRIFPFSDAKCIPYDIQMAKTGRTRPCFNRQIGLCPGVCTGEISKADYNRQILHLKLFFEGKKKQLVRQLTKEMNAFAKTQEFERAEKVKRTLFALDHIQDVSLLKHEIKEEIEHPGATRPFRIEAYDIAHMSGTSLVGVMVVIEGGIAKKSDYRKFIIRGTHGGNVDDTNNLKEVISRRLNHPEWPLPDLVVIDGGQGQMNAAREILKEKGFTIEVASVVKDERHKPREILGLESYVEHRGREILLANAEAHRFAIAFHRKKREKFLP